MASSKKAIYAAIIGNAAIAVTKFTGAAISGSSAMLTEGIHSLVDTGNGGLLLVGIRRSQQPPDRLHPFGHGMSLYFYTLIVAVMIFAGGGGISIYEGIKHVLDPAPLEVTTVTILGISLTSMALNYIVLGLAVIFECGALWTAVSEFNRIRGDEGFWSAVRTSKDPTAFAVVFEDSAALAGLLVAGLGIFLAHQLQMPVLDGAASICIGVILCLVAGLLVRETHGLLLGEAALPEVQESIRSLAADDPDVEEVGRLMTMHVGPYNVLLNLEARFRKERTPGHVEKAIVRLEERIKAEHPEITNIFIESHALADSLKETESDAPPPPHV